MNTLFHEMCGDVVDDYTVYSTLMFSDDVTSAIKKLKHGKSDGYDGLSSDCYCNDTPLLSRVCVCAQNVNNIIVTLLHFSVL